MIEEAVREVSDMSRWRKWILYIIHVALRFVSAIFLCGRRAKDHSVIWTQAQNALNPILVRAPGPLLSEHVLFIHEAIGDRQFVRFQ